ncbi:MAG TPA: hypothetical protein DDW52_15525 [Planctomycetaceae bacterium]|nr:hypothetical protein [Planctomycetaceae bacterium]
MRILRYLLAVLLGVLAGCFAVAAFQVVSVFAFPMPESVSIDNRQQMTEWLASLPVTAKLLVLAGWALAAFVGPLIGRLTAANRSIWPGVGAGAILLGFTVLSLISIAHPLWLSVCGVMVYPILGVLGLTLAAPRESVVRAERQVAATTEVVFACVSDVRNFAKAVPHITNIEYLSESQYGVGTRFRETRLMNGKEAATELEVTELDENRLVRIVSVAGGTEWDTVFTTTPRDGATQMTMHMAARPLNFVALFLVPLILPMVSTAVEADMDAIKAYCEAEDSVQEPQQES